MEIDFQIDFPPKKCCSYYLDNDTVPWAARSRCVTPWPSSFSKLFLRISWNRKTWGLSIFLIHHRFRWSSNLTSWELNTQKQTHKNYSPLECYFHHFLGCHPPTWQAARVSISEMYYLGKCKKVRKESKKNEREGSGGKDHLGPVWTSQGSVRATAWLFN